MFGKSVGQKNAALALLYYRVSQIIAIVIGLIEMLLLHFCRDLIIGFFTSDAEMVAEINHVWPVLVVSTAF